MTYLVNIYIQGEVGSPGQPGPPGVPGAIVSVNSVKFLYTLIITYTTKKSNTCGFCVHVTVCSSIHM